MNQMIGQMDKKFQEITTGNHQELNDTLIDHAMKLAVIPEMDERLSFAVRESAAAAAAAKVASQEDEGDDSNLSAK